MQTNKEFLNNISIHPQLGDGEVRRKADDMRAGRFTSGTLCLYCELESRLIEDSMLNAVCYSEDWQLMAEGMCVHSRGREVHRRVGVTLRSRRIWMEGTYHVLLSHNGEPFAVAEFQYDGAPSMPCRVRSIGSQDMEYQLLTRVVGDDELRWYDVHRFDGMAEAKIDLVKCYCRRGFDALCREYGLSLRGAHRYAVITAPTKCSAYRLAEVLPRYLHFASSEVDLISCSKYKAEDISSAFSCMENKVVALTDVGALTTRRGREKLHEVELAIEDAEHACHILFIGRQEEMERLCKHSSVVAKAVSGVPRFDLAHPSVAERVEMLRSCVSDECLVLSPEAEDALARQVMTNADELLDWEEADYLHYVRTDLVERLRRRVQRYIDEGHEPNPEQLLVLQMEDFDITSYINMQETEEEPSSSEVLYLKSMTELDAMVGLSSLKAQLTKDFALMRFYEERRRMGLPAESGASHHMLFTGNPGTGKTTVARLIGKIYHAMGYLTKGEVISVDRTQLVGAHIGETEENMLNVLKRAKGNVLFIDEAYTLCDTTYDRRDFGYHVVEALLPVMADPHPDMIIIFAGYANEMERLMQVNQGLKGRFAHHLHFDDYTADELMQICDNLLAEYQYTQTDEARALLTSIVERMVRCKDRYFCNARWMKQFVESGLLPAMASRVMSLPHNTLSHASLTTIEVADVEAAEQLYAPRQVKLDIRPRIGFVA